MKKSLKFLALVLSSLTLASSAGFVGAAGPETSTETPTKTSAKTSAEFSDEEIKEFDSILKYLQRIKKILEKNPKNPKNPEYVLSFKMFNEYPEEDSRTRNFREYLKQLKQPEQQQKRNRNLKYEYDRFCLYCEEEYKEIPGILAYNPGAFPIIEALYTIDKLCVPCGLVSPCMFVSPRTQKALKEDIHIFNLVYAIYNKYGIIVPEGDYDNVEIHISKEYMAITLKYYRMKIFDRKIPLH